MGYFLSQVARLGFGDGVGGVGSFEVDYCVFFCSSVGRFWADVGLSICIVGDDLHLPKRNVNRSRAGTL